VPNALQQYARDRSTEDMHLRVQAPIPEQAINLFDRMFLGNTPADASAPSDGSQNPSVEKGCNDIKDTFDTGGMDRRETSIERLV